MSDEAQLVTLVEAGANFVRTFVADFEEQPFGFIEMYIQGTKVGWMTLTLDQIEVMQQMLEETRKTLLEATDGENISENN